MPGGAHDHDLLWSYPISEVEVINEEDTYSQASDAYKKELFESKSLLTHTPIQSGDIFTYKGDEGSRYFLLLAQPCDLSVRIDGTRSQRTGNLIPIIFQSEKTSSGRKERKKLAEFWSSHTILEYFSSGEITDQVALLEFSKSISIGLSVLDLAVFSPDGSCTFDIKKTSSPKQLPTSWQKNFEYLSEQYKLVHLQIQAVKKAELPGKRKIQKAILAQLTNNCELFEKSGCKYKDGRFEFSLTRTCRLRSHITDIHLNTYTNFLSRGALEFDFSR